VGREGEKKKEGKRRSEATKDSEERGREFFFSFSFFSLPSLSLCRFSKRPWAPFESREGRKRKLAHRSIHCPSLFLSLVAAEREKGTSLETAAFSFNERAPDPLCLLLLFLP
jgi:hypothetical protein